MANNVNTNLDPAITIKKPNTIDPSTVAKSTTINTNLDPQLSAKKSFIVAPHLNRNNTVNTPSYVPSSNNITINQFIENVVKNYIDTFNGTLSTAQHALVADVANSVAYTNVSGRPNLATVALTGDYNNIINTPSLSSYATTSYVDSAVAGIVSSAPAALNTLNELANAIANDSSFSTTISSALGNRLRFDIGTQNLNTSQKANAVTNLGLSTVASSGSYTDLTNKPIIPTLVKPDWNQVDTAQFDYIRNKPTLVTSLDSLTDVVITGATNGQVLKFNGTNWINDTDSTGGGGSSFDQDLNTTDNVEFNQVNSDTLHFNSGASVSEQSDGESRFNIVINAEKDVIIRTDEAGNAWNFAANGTTSFPNNTIAQIPGSNLTIKTSKIITTDNTIGTNGSQFYTDINLGGGIIIDGWHQRNPQQIEINIFTAQAPIWSVLIGASLGATAIVTYSTLSGNQTFTSVLSQQFTGTGQYDSGHDGGQRYSGRIDGTLPTDQTGIVSINFPTSSITNSNWVFDKDGNLTLPGGGVLGDAFNDGGLTLKSPAFQYVELGSYDGNTYAWIADREYYAGEESSFIIGTDYTGADHRWKFDSNGILSIPIGGDIRRNGQSVLGTPYNQSLNTTNNVTFHDLHINGNISQNWNNFTKTSGYQLISPGQTTDIWTANNAETTSAKFTVQFESRISGGNYYENFDTLTCEIVMAKRIVDNTWRDAPITVYAIVHTSENPLVTFGSRIDTSTGKAILTCTPDASITDTSYLKVHSVEMQSPTMQNNWC